jgi:predicted RNA-binding Zn-ribbon protein involved in translation (DUF1610 family)
VSEPRDGWGLWFDEQLAFAVCPNCGAEYPTFHSMRSGETLCDECGWSSDEITHDAGRTQT